MGLACPERVAGGFSYAINLTARYLADARNRLVALWAAS